MRRRGESLARALTCACALAAATAGCGQTEKAPLPEALVVVDTNLPVPLAVTRLRIDLYGEDGAWFASNDLSRDDPRAWPVSFSVFADEGQAKAVWVRLRAYPEGYVEPYSGERFAESPTASRTPGDGQPRLFIDGIDRTPDSEPAPIITVDRLVRVRLRPNERGRVKVLLHGACVGTMAKLGPRGVPDDDAASCVATEKQRAAVSELSLEPSLVRPTESAVGTWLADERCPEDAPDSATVCIPGGATMFGSVEDSQYLPSDVRQLPSRPVRIFGQRRFFIDRDEATVARVRDALARGYTGGRPRINNGPVTGYSAKRDGDCTFTDAPSERESWAATCVTWTAARALCQFWGGDLPSEIQWEHVATVAGHPRKRRFPWGNETPTCERSVFAREGWGDLAAACSSLPAGPRPMQESEDDVSPLGIKRLFGNVQEWVKDDPLRFDDPCWLGAPTLDPSCSFKQGNAERLLARGTGYAIGEVRPSARLTYVAATVGFRCVYAERP